MTVLIDSNCWIQYFFGSKKLGDVRRIIEASNERILLSVVNLAEVYAIYLAKTPNEADEKITFIRNRCELKEVNYQIAVLSAKLKKDHKLSTVDSIILATAKLNNAQLITTDKDFKDIQGVHLI